MCVNTLNIYVCVCIYIHKLNAYAKQMCMYVYIYISYFSLVLVFMAPTCRVSIPWANALVLSMKPSWIFLTLGSVGRVAT